MVTLTYGIIKKKVLITLCRRTIHCNDGLDHSAFKTFKCITSVCCCCSQHVTNATNRVIIRMIVPVLAYRLFWFYLAKSLYQCVKRRMDLDDTTANRMAVLEYTFLATLAWIVATYSPLNANLRTNIANWLAFTCQ